jgi:signal peptidase
VPQTKYTTQEQIDEMRKEILLEKQRMNGIRVSKDSGGDRPAKRRAAAKKAGSMIFAAVILLLAANLALVYSARSRGEIPVLMGGFQLFAVESGSMEPTLDVGTLILCRRPRDAGSLKKDDIVTFRTLSGSIVTHRIVEVAVGEDGGAVYRTKGDNPRNSVDPEQLTPDRVLGVFVARIPLT